MSESFEEVCASYGDCTWIGRDEVNKVIARLQMAHEHELEQTDKSAYHRGYEDGKKSMDAEHRAVAMRLRRIRFDGGSHENLNKLAYAIYPCATGWTCESCDGLRDELIRLMGGVHEPVSVGADCGACGADCDCGAGEPWRVSYDELDNERHKAVCRLREWAPDEDGTPHRGLWEAVTGEKLSPVPLKGDAELDIIMRDRLIHLLGGDEPYSNLTRTILEPNLPKSAETAKPESDDGGKITITDELRECVNTATKTYDDTPWHEFGDGSEADHTICHMTEGELLRVADSIDEWFKRLCEQQEAVLQQTIERMADERGEGHDLFMPVDVFLRVREELTHDVKMWRDRAEDMRMERDELQVKLDRSRAEYCETCEEAKTTDILRAKLDAIREALDG